MYWFRSSTYVNRAYVIRIIKIMLTEEDILKLVRGLSFEGEGDNMD